MWLVHVLFSCDNGRSRPPWLLPFAARALCTANNGDGEVICLFTHNCCKESDLQYNEHSLPVSNLNGFNQSSHEAHMQRRRTSLDPPKIPCLSAWLMARPNTFAPRRPRAQLESRRARLIKSGLLQFHSPIYSNGCCCCHGLPTNNTQRWWARLYMGWGASI